MEAGKGACANLAKAAAALTVLSLLPVALSGSAPSHASAGLLPISWSALQNPIDSETPTSSVLFGSFAYEPTHGEARGTYVTFVFTEPMGPIRSYITSNEGASVQYIDSIDLGPFLSLRDYPQVRGPTFYVQGFDVEIRAHDDPTGLLEIRTTTPRTVTFELPPTATNIVAHAAEVAWPGSWPASSVSYTIGEAHARFVLGVGSLTISGTEVVAQMASSDLLVFKAIPSSSLYKAEWRALVDAITAGQVGAEFGFIATADGRWVENSARYRIDVAAWSQRVAPGRASVHVNSTAPIGAVVLLAFDPDTMPADSTRELHVRANGVELNVTADTLGLFFAPESGATTSAYAVLPLPGTVLAVYLPSLAPTSLEVESAVLPTAPIAFGADSALALLLALLVVAGAASLMFRRRES